MNHNTGNGTTDTRVYSMYKCVIFYKEKPVLIFKILDTLTCAKQSQNCKQKLTYVIYLCKGNILESLFKFDSSECNTGTSGFPSHSFDACAQFVYPPQPFCTANPVLPWLNEAGRQRTSALSSSSVGIKWADWSQFLSEELPGCWFFSALF
jgi:hypothetical protein